MSVAVVAIVLAMGVPSFTAFSRNSQMASAVNGLMSAIHRGRSEAVKRRRPVTICMSSDPLGADPECDGGDGGYFGFVDANDIDGDGFPDGDGVFDEGELVVLQRDAPALEIEMLADGDGGYLAYGANGYPTTYAGLGVPVSTFVFCDDRGNAHAGGGDSVARVVTVSGAGRPQLLRTVNEVAAAAGLVDGDCP